MVFGHTLVSVIVPVYNTEECLERCLKSIAVQTHANLDIILVDDGSTDDSSILCDKFAKSDKRINVIHKLNGGVSSARNAGLKYAKGDFIGFVDSDDWIEPNMFERLLKAVCDNGKMISVCGHTCHYVGGFIEKRVFADIPVILPVITAIEYLVSDRYFEGFMYNKLFDRRVFFDNEPVYFDEGLHFCEDLLAASKLFLKSDGVIYVPESLYHYCIRENGAMMSYGVNRLSELVGLEKTMDCLSKLSLKIEQTLKIRYVNSAINLYRMAFLSGDKNISDYLRKEAKKYWTTYFTSSALPLKMKLRGILILLFPKFSNTVWIWIKQHFHISWYTKIKRN